VDIAGLVRGASEGKGMGNAFLGNIKAVDGIFHVVRVFPDETVMHVEGDVNPVRDLEIISEELLLKDIETMTKYYDSAEKLAKRDRTKKGDFDVVQNIYTWLVKEKKEIRFGTWTAKEVVVLNQIMFLTAKPIIYLLNLSEQDFVRQKNKWFGKIKQWVEAKNKDIIIPFSASLELMLSSMSASEAEDYCKQQKVRPMLPKIISTGYSSLQLITFFTVGEDEVRAWTIHKTTKAPQAGAVIHTDFESYFICAEIMSYVDLKELGSELEVKGKGKYYQQGKLYVVQDGDIILFKHGGGGGGKKK